MIRTMVKLGVFIAVCLAFTAWLAFTIGNIHLFEDTYKVSAVFDDVTGLLPNDNVKVAGVPVGKVTAISTEQGRARVTFTVRKDVKLPTDSKAAVRWRNLLGQRFIYLYPGRASTVLEGGGEVRNTVSVVDLGELFNRLGPIVKAIDPDKVNEFLDTITQALDGNEGKVRAALGDLATLMSALASRDDAIGRLVANLDTVAGTITDRDEQIRAVLDNLLAISTTFNEHTDVLDEAVTELRDFSEQFGGLLAANRDHLDRSLDNLTKIVEVVRAKLPTVDHAVAGLDEAARRLFNASRHGEWLNQTIPCGAIGLEPRIEVNDCILDSSGPQEVQPDLGGGPTGPDASAGGRATPTSGARAITELLGGLLT